MCDVDEWKCMWTIAEVRGERGKNVQGFRRLLYPWIGRCQATLYYTNSNMCIAQMCFQNGLEKWGKWLLVNIPRAESWLLKKRPKSQLLSLDGSGIQISPFSENGSLIPSQPNWTPTPRGESHADFSCGLRDNICHLKSRRDHFFSLEFLFLWVTQTWCSGMYMAVTEFTCSTNPWCACIVLGQGSVAGLGRNGMLYKTWPLLLRGR